MNIPAAEGTTGKILISSPAMSHDIFGRSVVLMLGHDSDSAMGVILNRTTNSVNVEDLCKEFKIENTFDMPHKPIHFGGPVSMNSGIVLHPTHYHHKRSVPINHLCNATSCFDILQDFQKGSGPKDSMFILGYAGWESGQLEEELKENDWIVADASEDMIFGAKKETLWEEAIRKAGIGSFAYTPVSGNA